MLNWIGLKVKTVIDLTYHKVLMHQWTHIKNVLKTAPCDGINNYEYNNDDNEYDNDNNDNNNYYHDDATNGDDDIIGRTLLSGAGSRVPFRSGIGAQT